jgi:NAD(P)-dependent dehydrogenase (short-subunit alcohol dehydrogenase family)
MFTNKRVIVVGGSRGIGAGVVDAFVDRGAEVWYISRSKGNNKKATHIKADISDLNILKKAFAEFSKEDFYLDILINVAATNYCKKHYEISDEEWDEVMNTNLRSYFIACREALGLMKPHSKIVNVSSIAGRNKSICSGVHYTSSKAGIIGLTRQLAHEVGPMNINVNCVCPSQTMTEMLKKSMTESEMKELANNIPLKRLARIEDVVNPILFLCSEGAAYVNGACLDVNGGQL